MAKKSHATHAVARAHNNLSAAFEIARKRLADVPLGHEQLDPRTTKARQDLLNALMSPDRPDFGRAHQQATAKDTNPAARDRAAINTPQYNAPDHPNMYERKPRREPDKRGPARQNPKMRSAGKIVDPTAIETAQAVDPQVTFSGNASGPVEGLG